MTLYFQRRSPSEAPGVRTSAYEFGGQNSIQNNLEVSPDSAFKERERATGEGLSSRGLAEPLLDSVLMGSCDFVVQDDNLSVME